MADEKIRYVLDVDDKGTPKLVKFGEAAKKSGDQAKTSFDKFVEGMTKAASKFPSITSGMSAVEGAATALANPLVAIPVALASIAVVGAACAKANATLVVEMSHLSSQTGMTVNELLAFKRIGGPLGISVETVANASSKLSLNLSKNSTTLRALGVTAKTPIEAMAQVADKFSESTSASFRARLANEAFGKSWKELAPLLDEGGKKIRDAAGNGVLSNGMIERYKEIHERTLEIRKTWPKIKGAIGDVTSGPLNDMLGIMVKIAKYETDWVADFRRARGAAADIEVTQTFTNQYREKTTRSRAGTTNKLDEEAAYTAFLKLSAEQRKQILAGSMQEEQSLISQAFAVRLQKVVNNDNRIAAETEAANARLVADAEEAEKRRGEIESNQKRIASVIAGNSKALALRKAFDATYASVIEGGFDSQRALLSANAAKEIAQVEQKYAETESIAGISASQVVKLERQKSAEIIAINNDLSKALVALNAKDETEALRKKEKERADNLNAEKKNWDSLVNLAREGTNAQIKVESEKAKATREAAKDRNRNFETNLASELGAYNSNLTEMVRGKKNFSDTMDSIEDGLKNRAVERGLTYIEEWIAQQLTMVIFGDSVKSTEAAKAAALGAEEAAAYAPAAAFASTMSFGGAAVAGGAALAAALALAASYDVGTPSVQGDQLAKIHNRETILPTWASIPAQRGDWGPAQRFMGQTGSASSTSTSVSTSTSSVSIGDIHLHISGQHANAEQIANDAIRKIKARLPDLVAGVKVRADKIQGRTRAGTSF